MKKNWKDRLKRFFRGLLAVSIVTIVFVISFFIGVILGQIFG